MLISHLVLALASSNSGEEAVAEMPPCFKHSWLVAGTRLACPFQMTTIERFTRRLYDGYLPNGMHVKVESMTWLVPMDTSSLFSPWLGIILWFAPDMSTKMACGTRGRYLYFHSFCLRILQDIAYNRYEGILSASPVSCYLIGAIS